jgi:hypothetical protein
MRAHLASLDTGQGRATAWNARERATIERLVVAQRAVFVIRDSAQPEDSLAAYDRATGKQLRWRPAPNDHVNALARSPQPLCRRIVYGTAQCQTVRTRSSQFEDWVA